MCSTRSAAAKEGRPPRLPAAACCWRAGLLFGRKSPAQIWACVVLSVAGLYLLCMQGGFGGVEASDGVLLLCAGSLGISLKIYQKKEF